MPSNSTEILTNKDVSQPAPAIQLLGQPVFYKGYAFGFQQPSVRCPLLIRQLHTPLVKAVSRALRSKLSISDTDRIPPETNVVQYLLYWVKELLVQANHPVMADGRCQRYSRNNSELMLFQPCLNGEVASGVIAYLVELLNFSVVSNADVEAISEKIDATLDFALKGWSASGLKGFNQVHFLLAANELNIPWTHLLSNLFQLGLGARARWLDSSMTDKTAVVGFRLARDKYSAAKIMKMNGLPIPAHGLAKNEEQAIKIAQILGYPIVVKPADLDGGQGVKANLQNAEAVKVAFTNALQVSRQVLIEKHVPGSDYRIQVVNGEIQGILERRPGGVTGNGINSVRTLLEIQNQERKTATDDRRHLHQMVFDEEATEQLTALSMNWDSVPEDGRFIRLRGAANVAGGGVPTEIPLEEIHPDNALLAIRAVRALRLDVGGVDLLIPDIHESWLTTGAYICEVNAMPQMFTTMHLPMLRKLFQGGNGRIPVVVIIENQQGDDDLAVLVHQAMLDKGLTAGLSRGSKVWIGRDCVLGKSLGSFSGAKLLCHDKTVEAMVISICDGEVITKGWPVDRCDLLVLNTDKPPAVKAEKPRSMEEWAAFSSVLAPKRVIVDNGNEKVLAHARTVFKPETMHEIRPWDTLSDKQAIVTMVVEQLFESYA